MNENFQIMKVQVIGPLPKRGGSKPETPPTPAPPPPPLLPRLGIEPSPSNIGDKFAWSERVSSSNTLNYWPLPITRLTHTPTPTPQKKHPHHQTNYTVTSKCMCKQQESITALVLTVSPLTHTPTPTTKKHQPNNNNQTVTSKCMCKQQ